jgi:hypothetical protein
MFFESRAGIAGAPDAVSERVVARQIMEKLPVESRITGNKNHACVRVFFDPNTKSEQHGWRSVESRLWLARKPANRRRL